MDFSKTEIVAVMTGLAGAVGFLWRSAKAGADRDREDLSECRENYDKAHKEIKDLNGKYQYLKGRMDGVEQLSRSVLQKLESRRETDDDSAKNS